VLIERGQTISGIDVVVARDVVRAMQRGDGLAIEGVEHVLRGTDAEPMSVVAALESAGLIVRVDIGHGHVWWRATLDGNRLAKARIGKPIPRAKAQASLDALVDRVSEVNADQNGLFSVETVEVFGSFNDASRDRVGDVDVRVVYSCRIGGEDLVEQSLAAATASGRNLSYVAAMFFLESQFRKRLNGRNLDIEFSRTEAIQPIPDPNPQVVYRRQ
jgi:hypothetical protein